MTDNTTHFSKRDDRRKNLVVLAGLLALVLVANGVVGLFGLHYANTTHLESFAALELATDALETARNAQVHFKKQVQEWKNILIRGDDAQEFAKYRKAFVEEGRLTQADLGKLQALTEKLGVASKQVEQVHQGLTELVGKYDLALGNVTKLDAAAADLVDQKVRGIDRKPTDDLDAIVEQIHQRARAMREGAVRQTEARYQSLRKVSMAGTTIGILVVLAFLGLSFANSSKA